MVELIFVLQLLMKIIEIKKPPNIINLFNFFKNPQILVMNEKSIEEGKLNQTTSKLFVIFLKRLHIYMII